ncbi:MAG: hypothetical protein C0469_02100 [Cyanobacteria bacterium DS2.3.42]|nr:hypothetical protein [Cyanobacteria bacterium DS2.3.42]
MDAQTGAAWLPLTFLPPESFSGALNDDRSSQIQSGPTMINLAHHSCRTDREYLRKGTFKPVDGFAILSPLLRTTSLLVEQTQLSINKSLEMTAITGDTTWK